MATGARHEQHEACRRGPAASGAFLFLVPLWGVACGVDVEAGARVGDVGERQGALTPTQAAALGDEFTGTSLDPSWSVVNAGAAAITVGGGALHIVATQSSLWFEQSEGVLVYKLVPGDFKATTTVHTRKASNAAAPPDLPIELGGVMARDPAGPPANWSFIVIGFGEQGHIAVEHKDTVNGASTFAESPWTPDAELRLCRVGATVAVYKRHIGETSWGLPDFQTTRASFPSTLQVGLNMYAAETPPDLDASFDRIAFAPAATLADCVTDQAAAPPVPALGARGLGVTALALGMVGAAAAWPRRRSRRFWV